MRRCEVAFEQRRSIADVVREAISQYIAKRPAKRGNQRLVVTVHHVTVLRASVSLTPLMIR